MATAIHDYKLSEYLEVAPAPSIHMEAGGLLVFSTRSGRLLLVSSEVWEEVVRGDYASLCQDVRDRLVESEVLVPSMTNERLMLTNGSRSASRNVRTLTRMILPTAYCQLGCSYCGQEHSQTTMNRNAMDALVNDVRRSLNTGSFDSFLVTWFGGEPTTTPDVIRHLSDCFLRTCEEFDVAYQSRMITNGLALTPALAEMLSRDCRVSLFTISLDGPADIHDSRRATKAGKGTFGRILRNLRAIANSEKLAKCALHVRVNIDKDNAPYVHELIELLADLQLARRVDVDLAVVVPWPLHSTPQIIERSDFAEKEIAWLGHLLSRGFRANLLPAPRAAACLAAEPSSAVVATNGVLHNCALTPLATHEITPSTRPLGHVNFSDPRQGLDRHDRVFKLLSSREIPCSSCKYLFLCQGSCPKDLEKGFLNCPGYKFNLPARMAMHYLMKTRRDDSLSAEPIFDFSHSDLDFEGQRAIKETALAQIALFCSRFAMFRVPDTVVLYSGAPSDVIQVVEESVEGTCWNHCPEDDIIASRRHRSQILKELSQCYLSQINSDLNKQFPSCERVEAETLASAFCDWASSLLLDGYEAASMIGQGDARTAISRIARQACIEHFMAQPIDRLLTLVRDIAHDTAELAPPFSQAVSAPPASNVV